MMYHGYFKFLLSNPHFAEMQPLIPEKWILKTDINKCLYFYHDQKDRKLLCAVKIYQYA